jgi:hypothetical protein
LAAFGLFANVDSARADWGTSKYGGYQPCWAFWSRWHKCRSPEEERWQKFWHDYYDALQHYYDRLDNIDWVTYYKYHGYQINGGCAPMGGYGCGPCGPYGACGGHPQYAPVFVSPAMQWAVPNSPMGGAGCAPGGGFCPPGYGNGHGYSHGNGH